MNNKIVNYLFEVSLIFVIGFFLGMAYQSQLTETIVSNAIDNNLPVQVKGESYNFEKVNFIESIYFNSSFNWSYTNESIRNIENTSK